MAGNTKAPATRDTHTRCVPRPFPTFGVTIGRWKCLAGLAQHSAKLWRLCQLELVTQGGWSGSQDLADCQCSISAHRHMVQKSAMRYMSSLACGNNSRSREETPSKEREDRFRETSPLQQQSKCSLISWRKCCVQTFCAVLVESGFR